MRELPKKLLSTFTPTRDMQYVDPKEFKKILAQATLLPVALSLFLSALFVLQIYSILDENNKVRHSDEVLNYAAKSLQWVIDSETGFRGYIITNNVTYLEPWKKASANFESSARNLLNAVRDNPMQVKDLENIRELYNSWLENANSTLAYRKKFNSTSTDYMIKKRKIYMDGIRSGFDQFNERERELRNTRWHKAEETSKEAILIIIGLGVFLGFVLSSISLMQLRRLSKNYTRAFDSLSAATEHLEETVAQRTHELVLVNKELEAFSYSVSHDLRAPLRGIDGFSQILADDYGDKLDGDALKYLGFIRSGVQKMGILIDDLINLSRLTRTEFKKDNVDLAILTEEIMQEFRVSEPDRKVAFTNFLPQKIDADKGLLRAALHNLISNALKYSRKKDIAHIELGQSFKDGKVTYFVRDNGVGFDMRYYDKLFQPFQRLHPKDQFDGTGIGLATVARIIRRHNGVIWAESEVGLGSTFYFTLG